MKTIAAAEAGNRFSSVLDAAQRAPVVIQSEDRDVAVVMSMSEYERLRTGNAQAFLDIRSEVAAQATANGLTDERLTDLLTHNGV
jgi:prevent-host-death family protein